MRSNLSPGFSGAKSFGPKALGASSDAEFAAFPSYALLDALPDAALLTDTAGRVRYLNVSALRLLRVSQAEVCGRPAQDILALLDGITREPIHEPFAYLLSGADIGPAGRHDLLVRPRAAPIPFEYSIGSIRAGQHGPAGFVLLLRDATRTHARVQHLIELARRDEHTQLLRRSELERRLTRALESVESGPGHALLFMDLDRFKAINDRAGHAAGDEVLREVAARLRAQVRGHDVLARLGGDEFGLLFERCALEQARDRARSLQATIDDRPFEVENRCFTLGVSIGIAAIRGRRYVAGAAIAAADSACYRAKQTCGDGPRICEVVLE
jgi:diguanylate cyclase (GGDEF)-like protein/PAS domain S-box-containing protein